MWEKKLAIYEELIDCCPDFERKGKSMAYTSANGYMFSQLNKDGEIGIRLPKAVQKEFIEKYDAKRFKSYGAFMKDYVCVPDELLADMDLVAGYLQQGYDFVMSLEPK